MKGNLYLTKNQYGRNEICCAEDNDNHMNNMGEKEFADSNFNSEIIWQISIFKKLPIFTKIVIFKVLL